jgi:hypothetical protein
VETKNDVMAEICSLLSLEEYKTTVGSSVPRRFYSDVLDFFNLPDEGDATHAAKSIITASGIEWKPEFDSSDSASGGGGTVTLAGLRAIRQSVIMLLDEQEAESASNIFDGFDPAQESEWTLLRGQSIRRKMLHDRYGGVRQGGIAPSNRTKNIFLFTEIHSNREHGYEADHWLDDETFLYCGEGQAGNQSLTRYNYSILNHKNEGRSLRLFSPVSGDVTYLGELEIDDELPYEWIKGFGRDGLLREVVMFRLKRVIRKAESITDHHLPSSLVNFGNQYRFADEQPRNVAQADLFTTDPNLLDRALQIHSLTQNMVAQWVLGNGLTPISPSEETCDFDIAWDGVTRRVVCEVKSISDTNERQQFRMGLGQVLEYAHHLDARPVLVLSRKPLANDFVGIAHKAGVLLLWPELFSKYDPSTLRDTENDQE